MRERHVLTAWDGRSIDESNQPIETTTMQIVCYDDDPETWLNLCQDGIFHTFDVVSGFITSCSATQSAETGWEWLISMTVVGFDNRDFQEDPASFEQYPAELHYEWGRGGAGVAIVTLPTQAYWPPHSLCNITIGGSTMGMYCKQCYSWTVTSITQSGFGTQSKQITYTKGVFVDGMEKVSRSYIPKTMVFPGRNGTECYHDGSDHTATYTDVMNHCFSACGLSAPSGLSDLPPISSGFNGENTFYVSLNNLDSLSSIVARVTAATGRFLFASGSSYYFAGGGGGSFSEGDGNYIWTGDRWAKDLSAGMRLIGSGYDYTYFVPHIAGMYKGGEIVESGGGTPIGGLVNLSCSSAVEMTTAMNNIINESRQHTLLMVFGGRASTHQIPQPNVRTLSISANLVYGSVPNANYWWAPVYAGAIDPLQDEIVVKVTG